MCGRAYVATKVASCKDKDYRNYNAKPKINFERHAKI